MGSTTGEIVTSQSYEVEQHLDRLRGIPFWIWDRTLHEKHVMAVGERDCCFNHAIGLPQKWDRDLPVFHWQKMLYDTLQNHKHIWIKKSTGLGATEFMLRYLAYAIVNNKFRPFSRICVVTGPRIELAITLIDRFKQLFQRYFNVVNNNRIAIVNGVIVEAFPSHHLDDMRGLTNVKFILLDEADFFPPGEQQDARDVSERYIAKSQPWIVMVSTPNAPEGLFEKIEKEPDNTCLYKRIFLPYTVGLPSEEDPTNIYSLAEIQQQMTSPSFEREYNLKYLGRIGNVFHISDIEAALVSPEQGAEMMTSVTSPAYSRTMGLDPAWGTASDFGIVIAQKRNSRIEVFHAEHISQPRVLDVINHIMRLKQTHHVTKIYVDSANPEVIRELKLRTDDIAQQFTLLKDEDLWNMRRGDMQIIPISFQKMHIEMLQWAVTLMQKKMIRIHPALTSLQVALRTAVAVEMKLDKKETSYSDVLDAFRLALLNYEPPPPRD